MTLTAKVDTLLPEDQAACDIKFCAGAGRGARGTHRKQGSQLGGAGNGHSQEDSWESEGWLKSPQKKSDQQGCSLI